MQCQIVFVLARSVLLGETHLVDWVKMAKCLLPFAWHLLPSSFHQTISKGKVSNLQNVISVDFVKMNEKQM